MYTIKVEAQFSSAHNLREYKGKCESLHGHNWKIEAEVKSASLDTIGMAMDFSLLRKKLKVIIGKLDHQYLNKVAYFRKVNPTSENIAKYIFDRLKPQVKNLSSVTVWENPSSRATYEA